MAMFSGLVEIKVNDTLDHIIGAVSSLKRTLVAFEYAASSIKAAAESIRTAAIEVGDAANAHKKATLNK